MSHLRNESQNSQILSSYVVRGSEDRGQTEVSGVLSSPGVKTFSNIISTKLTAISLLKDLPSYWLDIFQVLWY